MMQLNLKSLAAKIVTVTALSAGAASAQDACSNYTVSDGDTLTTIAIAAYGSANYQQIFNANRNIVDDPTSLQVGMVLALPCDDGSLPSGVTAAEVIAQQEQLNVNVASANVYEPPVRFVTGSNWAPFADEGLTGGGFIPRLASTSLNRGGNNREYNISFVNDWSAHLDSLLPLGAFDITLAWYMPDCSDKSYEWSEETTKRCTGFVGTVPVYDTVVGFYTLPDSEYAKATDFSDLSGARICRMAGWFTHDLEQYGLVEPDVEMIRPVTAVECLETILNGTADVATFEVQLAADAMSEMNLTLSEVAESPYLTTFASLRFLAHKTNPRGRQYIALLNRGLNDMRQSGEWYAIISDTLKEQNDKIIAADN